MTALVLAIPYPDRPELADAPDTRPDCGLSARRIQHRRQRTPHDPEGSSQGANMAVLKHPLPIEDLGQIVAFIDNMI
jgi:hypothetical protein